MIKFLFTVVSHSLLILWSLQYSHSVSCSWCFHFEGLKAISGLSYKVALFALYFLERRCINCLSYWSSCISTDGVCRTKRKCGCTPCSFEFGVNIINRLTSNDHYNGHTAPLTSKWCTLYIYSTNIGTEYFKHGIYSPFFSSSKCSLFHKSNIFGSRIIHILYRGCAKIKKKIIPAQKV